MRIYMQTPLAAGDSPRFCHLILQKDLLEGWSLVRETGPQGRAGRVTKRHFQSQDDATEALTQERDLQIRKGFRVVFAEGVGK
ncbi:MAG: WGR domain-containing protein [Gammaproteobacteria bacterium]|nr:WGR domain-containing protein [Gammaproteobacteria bacterium]MCP5138012.1 WGR domain-containing protein [Gammaproteobacteria bacterium]